MLYLVHYPFECAEQRSSRILAIAALRDVLDGVQDQGHADARPRWRSRVDDDIEHLSQMQNYDGGFAFWDRGYPSEPYLTVYVDERARAREGEGLHGAAEHARARASRTCSDIEQHYPWYYPKEVRWAISAYALYTRKQIGDLDIAKGEKLLTEAGGVDKVSMETDGWLLGAVRRQQGRGDRAQGDRALRDEQRQRDRGRGELHDRLQRRQLSAARRAIAASTA